MSRIACFLVPLFPLAARLRSHPELFDKALAICEGNGPTAEVIAATRKARQQGIEAGMTLAQARTLLPDLLARSRDQESELSTQQVLLETAERFSPRVEDAAEGAVYLDLDPEGLERSFRPPEPIGAVAVAHPEELFAVAAIRAAEHQGLVIRVGIASSKLTAAIAARQPHSPTRVETSQEASFLAPLALGQLVPTAEIAAILARWGVRTVGEFAGLPADEISSRLGEIGHQLHLKARGLDSQPFVPYRPPQDFREGVELEWPLLSLEPLLFIARASLDRLCLRLESAGLGCLQLGYSLRLEPEGHHERRFTLPAATRDAKTLLTLMRLQLEADPPGAPVTGCQLSATPDRPRSCQLNLFGSPDLAPDRLATTLARLFALLGEGRVGSPRTADGHRAERFTLCEFTTSALPELPQHPPSGKGLFAVRVLRPGLPLEVLTGQEAETGERPTEVHPIITEPPRGPKIDGRIVIASGPWQLEESWWSEQSVEREYWDIEVAGSGLYRIFRDVKTNQWFADGVYD